MSQANEHLWPLSMVQIKAFLGVSTFLVGKFWGYSQVKEKDWFKQIAHNILDNPALNVFSVKKRSVNSKEKFKLSQSICQSQDRLPGNI